MCRRLKKSVKKKRVKVEENVIKDFGVTLFYVSDYFTIKYYFALFKFPGGHPSENE